MSGYIGNIPVPQATQTRDVFTTSAGQTSFATSGYTPGFLDVYLNGVKLIDGTDFTASNGSDVVLTTGATTGDTVEVLAFSTFEVAGISSGAGLFKGNNGQTGDTTAGHNDIFRVNAQSLTVDTTIDADENASATGPLVVANGVTLTVSDGGSLVIL
jgi:hypothetical protein